MAFDFGAFLKSVGPGISQAGQTVGTAMQQADIEKKKAEDRQMQEAIQRLQLGKLQREEAGQVRAGEAVEQFRERTAPPPLLGLPVSGLGLPSGEQTPFDPAAEQRQRAFEETRVGEFAGISPEAAGITEGIKAGAVRDKAEIDAQAKAQALEDKKIQQEFSNRIAEEGLTVRKERNVQLQEESKRRATLTATQQYETNLKRKALDESTQSMRAALSAVRAGKTGASRLASDLLLVKSFEKSIQPNSAVLEGEARAIQKAGTFLGRLVELGVYDAATGQLKGEIPLKLRQSMFELTSGLYKGRVKAFGDFRESVIKKNLTIEGLGVTRERAEILFPAVGVVEDIDNVRFDSAGNVIGTEKITPEEAAKKITPEEAANMSDKEIEQAVIEGRL